MRSVMIFLLWSSAIFPNNGAKASVVTEIEKALTKPAHQGQDTFSGHSASLVLNSHMLTDNHSCSMTAGIGNPMWWMVDLQDKHWIFRVSVVNLNDFAENKNFLVDIFTEDPRTMPGFPQVQGKVCGRNAPSMGTSDWGRVQCAPAPLMGRFVRVMKWGRKDLTLCGVRHERQVRCILLA